MHSFFVLSILNKNHKYLSHAVYYINPVCHKAMLCDVDKVCLKDNPSFVCLERKEYE